MNEIKTKKFKIGGIIYADPSTRLYARLELRINEQWIPLNIRLAVTSDGKYILANSKNEPTQPIEIMVGSYNELCHIKAVRITVAAIQPKEPLILHIARNVIDVSFGKEGDVYGLMIRVQFPMMLRQDETIKDLLLKSSKSLGKYEEVNIFTYTNDEWAELSEFVGSKLKSTILIPRAKAYDILHKDVKEIKTIMEEEAISKFNYTVAKTMYRCEALRTEDDSYLISIPIF